MTSCEHQPLSGHTHHHLKAFSLCRRYHSYLFPAASVPVIHDAQRPWVADVTITCTATARQDCVHKVAATTKCKVQRQLPQCQQHGQHTSNRLNSSRLGLVADVSASFVSTGLSSMSYQGLTYTSETISVSSATLISPVTVLQIRRNAFQRFMEVFLAQDNANHSAAVLLRKATARNANLTEPLHTPPRSVPVEGLRTLDYDNFGMFGTTGTNQACCAFLVCLCRLLCAQRNG